jgi:hypothetical protein
MSVKTPSETNASFVGDFAKISFATRLARTGIIG